MCFLINFEIIINAKKTKLQAKPTRFKLTKEVIPQYNMKSNTQILPLFSKQSEIFPFISIKIKEKTRIIAVMKNGRNIELKSI